MSTEEARWRGPYSEAMGSALRGPVRSPHSWLCPLAVGSSAKTSCRFPLRPPKIVIILYNITLWDRCMCTPSVDSSLQSHGNNISIKAALICKMHLKLRFSLGHWAPPCNLWPVTLIDNIFIIMLLMQPFLITIFIDCRLWYITFAS